VRRILLAGFLVSVAIAALGIAALGSGADERRSAVLKLRETAYGRILVNGQGRTLYRFGSDGRRLSRCDGACARTWPPFIVRGLPRRGDGVKARLLGTIRRPNGKLQLTYGGRPLYFYAHEEARQVLCQNVFEFGGLWLVVDSQGRAVR
jgi:predicted lipoprotein with Yx(FWY)xxD motif